MRLRYELLEPRQLLAADVGDAWQWFETFDDVPRIPLDALVAEQSYDENFVGPRELERSEWIVQLTDEATASVSDLGEIIGRLDTQRTKFSIISGLGSPGSVLVRGEAVLTADVRADLTANTHLASFSPNSLIEGQRVPNESDFLAGLLPGLETGSGSGIDAPTAWDVATGNAQVVVGIVDGGIDATHPDLFLNIWLNQGELPPMFLDDIGAKLDDIDSDGLITFYDLNNVTIDPVTFEQSAVDFAAGPNAGFVADLNANGRIDAIDLLDDVNWADGRDTDANGFFDDFFGINFRSGNGDPFAANRPLDQRGHGTHVAGTVGAVGNNGFGSVGVIWQTSISSQHQSNLLRGFLGFRAK